MPSILGISGSLRAGAFSTAILRTLGEAIAGKADFRLHLLHSVPPYNHDVDGETPPSAVAELRAAIAAADGIVIASPEYNGGPSGVLLNALDWASRPNGRAALTGKPVFLITSSPGHTGGVRAQSQLAQTLASIRAAVLLRPQAVVGTVHEKVVEGRLVHAATLDYLAEAADDLLAEIERLRP